MNVLVCIVNCHKRTFDMRLDVAERDIVEFKENDVIMIIDRQITGWDIPATFVPVIIKDKIFIIDRRFVTNALSWQWFLKVENV